MKPRTDTKEKIIELGTEIILSAGYPSLSYQQISSKLGIKNAAVHYHFPNKEDLGAEIVSNEIEQFEGFMASVADLSPWGKLEAFMASYRSYLEHENRICLVGAFASDYREVPERIQNLSADFFTKIKSWFIGLLQSGREEGAFFFKGNPENKASLITSAMAGGLQHARLIGNEHYDAVITQIKLELKE
jgi:TetR/AcrR family transcriptional repressor of nem operon